MSRTPLSVTVRVDEAGNSPSRRDRLRRPPAGRWLVRAADSCCQRHLGSDSPGKNWSEASGAGALAGWRRWDTSAQSHCSPLSELSLGFQGGPEPSFRSQRDELRHLAGALGVNRMCMGLLCFLTEDHISKGPLSADVAPVLNGARTPPSLRPAPRCWQWL